MEASCLVSAGHSSAVWGPLTHMCLPGAAGLGVTGPLPSTHSHTSIPSVLKGSIEGHPSLQLLPPL